MTAAALVLCAATALPGNAYPRPGATVMASTSYQGGDLTDQHDKPYTGSPSVSANGRYIAFTSSAQDLVAPSENPEPTLAKIEPVTAVFVHDVATGKNTVVSVRSDGRKVLCPIGAIQSCTLGSAPAISADGRYVAFVSGSPNLVNGDTNLVDDVYVHDLKTGSTVRASVDSNGKQADRQSSWPSISADGRYVAFQSDASNLVAGDTDNATDVFVHDLRTGSTTRVSVDSKGNQESGDATSGGAASVIPEISVSGRYVVFLSFATNLVASDTNAHDDVFIHDMQTRVTQLVSVTSDGAQTNGNSGGRLGVSADGRYVSFVSLASNVVPNDTNSNDDIFVRDRTRARTVRVSVMSNGEEASGPVNPAIPLLTEGKPAYDSSISSSGRFVEFWGVGTDFGATGKPVSAAANDMFVYDTVTGAVTMVSVNSAGQPATDNGPCTTTGQPACAYSGTGILSPDGRYVAFASSATNIDPRHKSSSATPDPNRIYLRDLGASLGAGSIVRAAVASPVTTGARGLVPAGAQVVGASIAYRPAHRDLFGRIELTTLTGVLYGCDLTVGGVRYQVRAQRIAGPDYDYAGGASFGLFRQEPNGSWTRVTNVHGGYGTTGSDVVFAVPLAALGASNANELRAVRAFAAVGSYRLGVLDVLDELTL